MKIDKVKWKNLLSTGDAWTEVSISDRPSTLIVGENGAGKSTIEEALSYGLFNKPFRDIKKDQLVNSVNGKGCEIEVDLTVGQDNYTVRRGVKPDFVEVLKNGKVIEVEGSKKDYQEWLQRSVLKMNYQTFRQIVILASASFTPFMQLTTPQRREFVEDLLDLKVFGVMNSILKSRVTDNNNGIKDAKSELEVEKTKLSSSERYVKDVRSASEERVEESRDKIEESKVKAGEIAGRIKKRKGEITDYKETISDNDDVNEEVGKVKKSLETIERTRESISKIKVNEKKIDELEEKISERTPKIEELVKETADKDSVTEELSDLVSKNKTLSADRSRIKKDRQFYEEHDECPTCTQNIDHAIKAAKKEEADKEIKRIDKEISEADSRIEVLEDKKIEIGVAVKKLESLKTDNVKDSSELDSLKSFVKKLKEDVSEATGSDKSEEELKSRLDDLDGRLSEIKGVQKNIDTLEKENADDFGEIKSLESYVTKLKADIKAEKEKGGNVEEEERKIEKCKETIKDIEKKIRTLSADREVMNVAATMLKDQGIKTQVVKQYVPIINSLVNKYLKEMEFYVDFELDEEFRESIRSRYRDDFSYASFSEGEKKRIDGALVLTWRGVAKRKASADCNLLVLDEVFDGSLDAEGCEYFANIMRDLEDKNNVFVISHNENMKDHFSNIIKFEKDGNFSKIASE